MSKNSIPAFLAIFSYLCINHIIKLATNMKRFITIFCAVASLVLLTSAVTSDRICSRCEGTGHIADNCTFCGGRGWRDCSLCNGHKSYRCNVCGGEGSYVCPQCRGYNEDCAYCKGSGRIHCDRCSGTGSITCERCGGAGNEPCYQCNQTGIHYWTCPECRGTGRVDD